MEEVWQGKVAKIAAASSWTSSARFRNEPIPSPGECSNLAESPSARVDGVGCSPSAFHSAVLSAGVLITVRSASMQAILTDPDVVFSIFSRKRMCMVGGSQDVQSTHCPGAAQHGGQRPKRRRSFSNSCWLSVSAPEVANARRLGRSVHPLRASCPDRPSTPDAKVHSDGNETLFSR